MPVNDMRRWLFAASASALLSPLVAMAADDDVAVQPTTLRVCQDPNNMPFSNDAGEGIENRIAVLFGKKLGLPVEYFSFPQRFAFVRNTLRYKLPGEAYRCDVMLGVPEGFGQVATTSAYYRSTYALVYVKGGKLDGVKSSEELAARAREAIGPGRLGIHDKSPAAAWLAKHDLTELAHPSPIMSPDPAYYPGHLIDEDLAEGKIDAAIVWGPIAGYFAPRVKNLELVVVPLTSEPGVRFDYGMAMGVRYGEPQWKGQIQRLIDESRNEIAAILKEFHVPLVDEIGFPIPATRTSAAGVQPTAGRADEPDASGATVASIARTISR